MYVPCERKKQEAAEGKMRERELLRTTNKHFIREGVFELGLKKWVGFQDEVTMRRGISHEGNARAKDGEMKPWSCPWKRGQVQWVSCWGQWETILNMQM